MDKTVGVLGGGQLGRMLTEAAHRLNIDIAVLDSENAPAKRINNNARHIDGSFKDAEAVRRLASKCDVLTVEIEHVNLEILKKLSIDPALGLEIHPSWRTIQVIQDKFLQKEHLQLHSISSPVSSIVHENTDSQLQSVAAQYGYPFMLKSRTEAYDGRGNHPVRSRNDFQPALDCLGARPLYAEQWIDFRCELAVMVVKTDSEPSKGWEMITSAFPVVETVHEDSICKLVYAPARHVSSSIKLAAQKLARSAVATLWGKGIFGVELFVTKDDALMVNEIAPRPHNSGHYTIDACSQSQFSAHLHAILGLPIRERSLSQHSPAIMLNILGGRDPSSHLSLARLGLQLDETSVHLYGKGEGRPGRKMGHITVLAKDMATAESRIQPLLKAFDAIKAGQPVVEDACQVHADLSPLPLVAVTMGSESDRNVLRPGIQLLSQLKIPYTVTITSAHRTPERMFRFAQAAASRGIKVIIAAAGGAAHLPGMIAALTRLPVIGVPVKGSSLDGQDSLLSIAQMPRGCPVATVAINNSINAAQLAARILANDDLDVRGRLELLLDSQTKTVEDQAQRMEEVGFEEYESK